MPPFGVEQDGVPGWETDGAEVGPAVTLTTGSQPPCSFTQRPQKQVDLLPALHPNPRGKGGTSPFPEEAPMVASRCSGSRLTTSSFLGSWIGLFIFHIF